MTPRRAAGLAALVVLLVAAGYLLMRRAKPLPPPAARALAPAAADPVPVAPRRVAEPVEQPLPGWVRVGIVMTALLAFFAVSLIATKQG